MNWKPRVVHSTGAGADLLDVVALRRTFGETVALDSCSLNVCTGEIHALVGENGSGKSTLIKILSGILSAESGSMGWDGTPVRFASPTAAQRAGVATVFQETLVLDEMSVRDNLMLGLDGVVRRSAKASQEPKMVREALTALGLGNLDIERSVGSLTLANRQLVGVARALLRPWRLLILDESTSALDVEDRDRLFETLRHFRTLGRSILFVSHRMDEINAIADRATVLRSGRSVATLTRDNLSTDKLLELMSARQGGAVARTAKNYAQQRTASAGAQPVVTVRDLKLRDGATAFDLDLHAGEIVGVAGLEGHGQVPFLECLGGLRRAPSGSVRAGQTTIRKQRDAVRRQITFLPRDRKTEGIFELLSVLDNVTVSCLRQLGRFGILNRARRAAVASEVCEQTKVKMSGAKAVITSLSGGNQQKTLLGRLLATAPRVLILNDPLRGIDLAAKRDLYDVLDQLAANGMCIVLLSTELVELCLLCSRVVVFHDYGVAATIEGDALDERALIAAMFDQAQQGTNAGAIREELA